MTKRISKIGFIIALCMMGSSSMLAQQVESCPNDNIYHMIANKEKSLSQDYKPKELVIPNVKVLEAGALEKNHMEKGAAGALEEMFKKASEKNIQLVAVSGYRSYSRQKTIYNNYIKKYGKKYTDTISAQPGKSEHQTGFAMDISAKSVGYSLTEKFGTTKEGKWLAENAHQFGFIIRYQKGKEKITGYAYEPWHVRYVGKELATMLYENKLTLEEVQTCCEKTEPLEKTTVQKNAVQNEVNKEQNMKQEGEGIQSFLMVKAF